VPNVEILWFCDKQDSQARKARAKWGKRGVVGTDFEDLLNQARPDVVHVCTPPSTHAEFACKALESGCHVLLEKPMTTSLEDAQRVLAVRASSGQALCMMHNHMFDPIIIRVRNLVESGALGELVYAEGRFFLELDKMAKEKMDRSDHWVYTLKSGIAGEYTPHMIYLLQSFLGPSTELQLMSDCIGSPVQDRMGPEAFAVQLRFEKGWGNMLMLNHMPYGHFSIHLYGTRAAAHVNIMDLTFRLEQMRKTLPREAAFMESTIRQGVQNIYQTLGNGFRIISGQLKRSPGHRGLIKAFYQSLRNGNSVPIPGEDGMLTVQTLDMLDRAVSTRENRVSVSELETPPSTD
jgi:predicted dehydrogenase